MLGMKILGRKITLMNGLYYTLYGKRSRRSFNISLSLSLEAAMTSTIDAHGLWTVLRDNEVNKNVHEEERKDVFGKHIR